MTRSYIISAAIITEDQAVAVKASEMLHRVSMGLALDGVTVRLDMTSGENESEDEEADQDSDSSGDRETP